MIFLALRLRSTVGDSEFSSVSRNGYSVTMAMTDRISTSMAVKILSLFSRRTVAEDRLEAFVFFTAIPPKTVRPGPARGTAGCRSRRV